MVLQGERTGQSSPMRSTNTTLTRDESIDNIKFLAAFGLSHALSWAMGYVSVRLLCCNYMSAFMAISLALLSTQAIARVLKL
jgi:hypothetical protein